MLKVEIKLKLLWNNIIKKIGRGYRFLFEIDLNYILNIYFPEGSDFTIIQIGANDGVSHDNIYNFITKRNSKGLLIEPIKDYFSRLCKNYKNYPELIKLNIALHPQAKEVKLFRVKPDFEKFLPDWVNGIASIDKKHHVKLGIPTEAIIEEIVTAKSFNELMQDFDYISRIDLIQIDTEGFDFEILKMIDFSKYAPKFLKFEHCNLTIGDYREAKRILKSNGYIIFTIGNDTIAMSKKL